MTSSIHSVDVQIRLSSTGEIQTTTSGTLQCCAVHSGLSCKAFDWVESIECHRRFVHVPHLSKNYIDEICDRQPTIKVPTS